MAYITDTATIKGTLQAVNCCLSSMGISYIEQREKGLICEDKLDGIELGFSMIDAISNYKAPSAEVLSTATGTIISDSGGTVQAFVNGVSISGVVASTGVINTTAANLAASINSTITSPEYTATATLNVVTVFAAAQTGAYPNGLSFTLIAASMSVSSTNFVGGVTNKTDTQPTVFFAGAADRISNIPTAIGIVARQNDTDMFYISTGLSAGNWVVTTLDCITLPVVNNIITRLKKLCKN